MERRFLLGLPDPLTRRIIAMPYEWTPPLGTPPESGSGSGPDPQSPELRLTLWPNRSLPRKGFVLVIGFAAGMLLIPLLAVLGSPVLWGLLPFLALAVWGLWVALQRNYRDGDLREILTITAQSMDLVRRDPRRPERRWQANPYWVRIELHETGGPVPNYLTLTGGDRKVEIGAFLAGEERLALAAELRLALARTGRSSP